VEEARDRQAHRGGAAVDLGERPARAGGVEAVDRDGGAVREGVAGAVREREPLADEALAVGEGGVPGGRARVEPGRERAPAVVARGGAREAVAAVGGEPAGGAHDGHARAVELLADEDAIAAPPGAGAARRERGVRGAIRGTEPGAGQVRDLAVELHAPPQRRR
jgi:hypothetical protein